MPVHDFRVLVDIQTGFVSVARFDIIGMVQLKAAHRLYRVEQIRVISVLFDQLVFVLRFYVFRRVFVVKHGSG